jgi:hypothetical protein
MSEAMKPTPGPWILGDENNECCDVLLGTEHNLTCNMDRRDNNTWKLVISREEMLDNARLIAEAGTVFHETGLSPRQIAERNAELVEAAGALLRWLPTAAELRAFGYTSAAVIHVRDARAQATAALAKCQPDPPEAKP